MLSDFVKTAVSFIQKVIFLFKLFSHISKGLILIVFTSNLPSELFNFVLKFFDSLLMEVDSGLGRN
jgi:hypothetical protein